MEIPAPARKSACQREPGARRQGAEQRPRRAERRAAAQQGELGHAPGDAVAAEAREGGGAGEEGGSQRAQARRGAEIGLEVHGAPALPGVLDEEGQSAQGAEDHEQARDRAQRSSRRRGRGGGGRGRAGAPRPWRPRRRPRGRARAARRRRRQRSAPAARLPATTQAENVPWARLSTGLPLPASVRAPSALIATSTAPDVAPRTSRAAHRVAVEVASPGSTAAPANAASIAGSVGEPHRSTSVPATRIATSAPAPMHSRATPSCRRPRRRATASRAASRPRRPRRRRRRQSRPARVPARPPVPPTRAGLGRRLRPLDAAPSCRPRLTACPFDYFLRIDGIPGESPDAKHKGEIDVLSWSWGETQAVAPSAGAAAPARGRWR